MAPKINKMAPIQNVASKSNKMTPIQNVAQKIYKMAPKNYKMAPIQYVILYIKGCIASKGQEMTSNQSGAVGWAILGPFQSSLTKLGPLDGSKTKFRPFWGRF